MRRERERDSSRVYWPGRVERGEYRYVSSRARMTSGMFERAAFFARDLRSGDACVTADTSSMVLALLVGLGGGLTQNFMSLTKDVFTPRN